VWHPALRSRHSIAPARYRNIGHRTVGELYSTGSGHVLFSDPGLSSWPMSLTLPLLDCRTRAHAQRRGSTLCEHSCTTPQIARVSLAVEARLNSRWQHSVEQSAMIHLLPCAPAIVQGALTDARKWHDAFAMATRRNGCKYGQNLDTSEPCALTLSASFQLPPWLRKAGRLTALKEEASSGR